MTKSLSEWIENNKLSVSESKINDSDIVSIEGVGTFLYVHPFDGKIIDEDFAFILSDEEFDLLDGKKVDCIPVQAVGSHHSVTVIMGKKEENDND